MLSLETQSLLKKFSLRHINDFAQSYKPATAFSLAFFTMFILLLFVAGDHISIPKMHSISAKLLWRNPMNSENMYKLKQSGAYVSFLLHPPGEQSQIVLAMKRVGCAEGDVLETKMNSTGEQGIGQEFFCNGSYLGRAKTHTLKGVPLHGFAFNGVVPLGKFFAIGDHKDSYDSRYIGFVDITQIREVATKIW